MVCVCYQFCSWSKQTLVSPPMQAICWRCLHSASSVEISSKTTGSILFNTSDIWLITFYRNTNKQTQTRMKVTASLYNQLALQNRKMWWITNVLTFLVSLSFINIAWIVSLSRLRSSFEMVPFSSSIEQMKASFGICQKMKN